MFAWDYKIFRTLQYLFFFPGRLTNEYLSGKVIRYVHPAKLFWFVTLIFFAVFTFFAGPTVSEQKLFGINEKDNVEVVETPNSESPVDKKQSDGQKKDVKLGDILDYFPYAMFLVIPFFALLLQILFYRKQHFYAGHLIFAFHFHTFIFLFFTLISLLDHYLPTSNSFTDKFLIWIPPIYFVIALWVVYRPNIKGMLWKVPFIMFIYGLSIVIVLAVFSALIIRYVYGVNIFDELNFE